jgi:hypothetical protein
MAASINVADLDPEDRKKFGIRTPRDVQFSKEELRGWSLKILALMSSLTRAQRERVLRHAMRVNKV